jgi:RimJ/RimL family protein N-acetyltransferase
MLKKNITLSGMSVLLRGVNETDFERLVAWRNDPEINRYLNQPYALTMDLQARWYHEKYLPSSDLLFVFVEKRTGQRIGTLGLNDFDPDRRRAIAGRLLIGAKQYRGSFELLEGNLLFYDFLFDVLHVLRVYCHIVQGNKKAIALDSRLGFVDSDPAAFPERCQAHGRELIEMVNEKARYEEKKRELRPMLEHFLAQYQPDSHQDLARGDAFPVGG